MSLVESPPLVTIRESIIYPDTDGQPMAENDWQRELIVDSIQVLEEYYQNRRDVYVSGDLLVYYREGNPRLRVAPDVLVVHGVEKKKRKSYLIWKERKAPDLVIEIASDSTWLRDLTEKSVLYHDMGVREYFLFDSTGERFGPLLAMKRRNGDRLEEEEPDERGRIVSEVLGLELGESEGRLRFYLPGRAEPLPTPRERAEKEAARAEKEAARAEKEAARAAVAEAERDRGLERIRELEARLIALGNRAD